jgi:hypothetical protein
MNLEDKIAPPRMVATGVVDDAIRGAVAANKHMATTGVDSSQSHLLAALDEIVDGQGSSGLGISGRVVA